MTMLSRRTTTAASLLVTVLMAMVIGASPALAHPFLFSFGAFSNPNGIITAVVPFVTVFVVIGTNVAPALAEAHPFLFSFGSFSNPNGIAVDESSGDVYVADLGTNTVSKFDASGALIESWGTKGVLDGSTTTAGPFSFPTTEPGTPAAIAVDNSTSPSDPSAGDLYVMDAGHNMIDKFNAKGEALTPITGPFSGPLLGLGIDPNGTVRVDDQVGVSATEVFDDSAANGFVKHLQAQGQVAVENVIAAVPEHGFAAGSPAGSDYALFSCGCVVKLGPDEEQRGRVDSGSTAVAAAVDPVSGHVYVDDQLSVSEWDTGEMNGNAQTGQQSSGTPVSTFGVLQLSGSPAQGGIAVDGASGRVYVSNPADGKVYVFGSAAPLAVAGAPVNITQTRATLQGTVDPRGVPATSCRFEYASGNLSNLMLPIAHLTQSVPCITDHGEPIGEGTSPVAVHADVSGLQPGSLYHFRLVAENADGSSPSGGLFPTVSQGFGIKSFEIAFLNKDGTPDTQAGSHPYQMVTNISFNTQIVQRPATGDLRYAPLPMGNIKNVIADLPPGFFGDPHATTKKCTTNELVPSPPEDVKISKCPVESELGILEAEFLKGEGRIAPEYAASAVWSMVPPPGVAFQLAGHLIKPNAFIDVGVPAGGNSGARAISSDVAATAPVFNTRLTIFGGPPVGSKRPFLTLPSACNGPLTSRVEVDSYQDPGNFAKAISVTRNSAGQPAGMMGCAQLAFPPSIDAKPDVSNASSSSGLNVGVHVSQKAALNPEGLAESALRDTTVALPPGVAVNPAGADGLDACSEGLVGFTGLSEFNSGFEPGDQTATFTSTLLGELQPGVSFCPDGSKIGTAKLKTPLLEKELEGAVYLATPAPNGEAGMNPFNSLIAMYMVIEDPVSGTLVKVPFEVKLCEAAGQVISGMTCQAVGQIITTAHNTPQLPFEDLQLHFFGGERAPLATPAHCGTYMTLATFTPWDGNAPVNTSSSFQIEPGPNGSPCPGGSLPFSPSLTAGSSNIQAGAFTPFTMTMSREDGEQNLQAVGLHMPPGLSGLLTGVKLCGEAEANAGTCSSDSEIGETTVSVGVGSNPFSVKGGKVYITGPYKGAPFGLSIVNPAKAGPFDLGKVVVRAKIEVDPVTTALTITSDNEGSFKIPQYIKGIPLQIKHVNVTITRPGFTFNPTNCSKMAITGSLDSTEGASQGLSVPFQATNCATLAFAPKFAVSTSGKTSKASGASLSVKLTYPKAPFGSQANIASVKVDLPKQLPSRLTTLQKACTAAQFKANPAGCPAASLVGHAKATTPLIPVPLEGPAYFVSNGGQAFPNLIMVLQGYGVTVDLVGDTFISKAGITSSTFKTVPDAPVSSFELTLPQGKFSALAANGNLCSATRTVITHKRVTRRVHGRVVHVRRTVKRTVAQPLLMPTMFTAQNGAVLKQTTKIAVTGCGKKKAKKASSSRHQGKGKAKKKGR
jgi:hypothetical protein